jgi:hypothetical protein
MPALVERETKPRRSRAGSGAAEGAQKPEAAPSVLFRASSGQRTKRVKTGFAWDLFLFAGVLGVPLFLRGLTPWGAGVLALWLADLALGRAVPPGLRVVLDVALFAAFLGLQLYLGFAGNALTARACRARGWQPDNPRDPGVREALRRWRLGPD